MNSLREKLSVAHLSILLALGALIVFGILRGANLYFEEVTYKLNARVAPFIAESVQPFEGAELDQAALQELFMDVMRINTSLELYLLDTEGRILAYDAPHERILRQAVSLEPILAALAAGPDGELIRGDDPRSLDRRKPFSVAPLVQDSVQRGYVYIVLAGEDYETVAATLGESRMLRWVTGGIIAAVLISALLGTLAIGFLNRPLRKLNSAMARFREGERVPASALVHEIAAGGEIGALATTFNEMAARIESQVEKLTKNDQRRREFIANVSHDLRTPTAAIQGYLETLVMRHDRLPEHERAAFLESALRQTERLGKLVDQLFELTRLEAHEFEPQKESFGIAELVQDVVAKFRNPAERKDIDLRANLAYDLPPVHADIGLIERALDNLIDNAIRYTRPGGKVEVSLSQVAGGVGVWIRDTGPGIPSDDLPFVFDRFYRVERATKESGRGTGLGLAITKRIADMHQASIEIETSAEQGTTFSFVLEASGSEHDAARV